jgi:hypothetical protein
VLVTVWQLVHFGCYGYFFALGQKPKIIVYFWNWWPNSRFDRVQNSTRNLSPKKRKTHLLTYKLWVGGVSVLLPVTQTRVLTRTSPGITRKWEHSIAQHSLHQLEMPRILTIQPTIQPTIHTCKILAWVRPSVHYMPKRLKICNKVTIYFYKGRHWATQMGIQRLSLSADRVGNMIEFCLKSYIPSRVRFWYLFSFCHRLCVC